jgi:MbtH protein
MWGSSVTNPFEIDGAGYLVLRNNELQYSIWPATIPVPAGWLKVIDETTRQACLEFIEGNWTDMRPASLVAQMRGIHE